MADIFISYAKADRLLVERLSASLEAGGWTVWFDRALSAGENYRDEIGRELAQARAVIVVWTSNSVGSDFVRAEAGRAKADSRLIPVKTADIGYETIPLPFGEMHTEPLNNSELVATAVARLLAQAPTRRPLVARLTSAVRYEVLTWFGIIGATITVFSGMQSFLQMADWIHFFLLRWNELTETFWKWIFSWAGFDLHAAWVPTLTFFGFAVPMIFGTWMTGRLARGQAGDVQSQTENHDNLAISNPFLLLAFVLLIGLGPMLFSLGLMFAGTFFGMSDQLAAFSATMAYVALIFITPVILLLACRRRMESLAFLLLYAPLVFLLGIMPMAALGNAADMTLPAHKYAHNIFSGVVLALAFQTSIPAALSLVAVNRLNRRVLFILLGVGILLGLNEISKFDLAKHLTAFESTRHTITRIAMAIEVRRGHVYASLVESA